MVFKFVPVTKENFQLACELKVARGQEGTVETVEQCWAEAQAVALWRPVLLETQGVAVGFAMYGFWQEEGAQGRLWLDRFFIDAAHQGKGYAKACLPQLLRHLRAEYAQNKIFLSVYESNAPARHLYDTLGFVCNGERDRNGELVMVQASASHATQASSL